MPFHPNVGDSIEINGLSYSITEHPSAKGMPYGQTGRRATVYQVQSGEDTIHGLKVFSTNFRTDRMVENAENLKKFLEIPGLKVSSRTIITPDSDPDLIESHPDLEYAVLMNWVSGFTWQEVILDKRVLSKEQCLILAQSFVAIMSRLESMGAAHCDLSGPNVLLPGLKNSSSMNGAVVELVDVEEMYLDGMPEPEKLPGGSPGYAHKTAPDGLWGQNADRFSGAIIIAELLTWFHEDIRAKAYEEQFFSPEEMQQDSDRYQLLLSVLREHYGNSAAETFAKAWNSETLDDCPTFEVWQEIIGEPTDEQIQELMQTQPAQDLIGAKTFQPAYQRIDDGSGQVVGAGAASSQADYSEDGFDDDLDKPVVLPAETTIFDRIDSKWSSIAAGVLAIGLIILGVLHYNLNQDLDRTQNTLYRATQTMRANATEIADYEIQATQSANTITDFQSEVKDLQAAIANKDSQISSLSSELDNTKSDLSSAYSQINNLEKQIDDLEDALPVKLTIRNDFWADQYVVIDNVIYMYVPRNSSRSIYIKPGSYKMMACHPNEAPRCYTNGDWGTRSIRSSQTITINP